MQLRFNKTTPALTWGAIPLSLIQPTQPRAPPKPCSALLFPGCLVPEPQGSRVPKAALLLSVSFRHPPACPCSLSPGGPLGIICNSPLLLKCQ